MMYKVRPGFWRIYLNALQLNSDTLFFFDGAMLRLSELVRQCHVLQLQMFQSTKLIHLSSLGKKRGNIWCLIFDMSWHDCLMCGMMKNTKRHQLRALTCILAISPCSRTLASWASASCCWYHCLTCWSESISAWEVFSLLCRVLRSSWTCCSWFWRPPICWRSSWTA